MATQGSRQTRPNCHSILMRRYGTVSGFLGRRAKLLVSLGGKPMGHIRLGTLPKTQKWSQVVNLIAGGADVERIAAASADAAEQGLERASQDEGLAHAFWLLTQIPQAARQSNFSERLWELGLTVSSKPTLLEIVAAFTRAVDGHVS